jgi:hypothetical protein
MENDNNPAWNDLLSKIPEDMHGDVTPILQDWDKGVQDRFQKVHSEYEPYKLFKENNVGQEDIQTALGVLRAIQEDPETVYKSLAESYGFGGDSAKPEQGDPGTDANVNGLPPEVMAKMSELEKGYNLMAEMLLSQKQKEDEAAQDESLKTEIAALKAKHGNFDEDYVLSHMLQGASPEDAVKNYNQMVERIMVERNRPEPPKLLGTSSGSFPGEGKIDVTKLNPAQTKNLVADWLAAQKANRQ